MVNRPWSTGIVLHTAVISSLSIQFIFLLFAWTLDIETTMQNFEGFNDDSNYINNDVLLNAVASDKYINMGYWWLSYAALLIGGEDYHEILLRVITSFFAAVAVYFFAVILARLRCQKVDGVCVIFALPISLLSIVIGKEVVVLALTLISINYFFKLQERFSFYHLALLFACIFAIFLFRYFFVAILIAIMGIYIIRSRINLIRSIFSTLLIMLCIVIATVYLVESRPEFIENLILTRIVEMTSEGSNYEFSEDSITQVVGGGIFLSIAKVLTYPPPIPKSYLYLAYIPLVYGATVSLAIWFFSRSYMGSYQSNFANSPLNTVSHMEKIQHLCFAMFVVSVCYMLFLIAINFESNARYKIIPLTLIYLVIISYDKVFHRYYWVLAWSIVLPLLIGIIYSIL